MGKHPPQGDIENIYFKYFVAGHDPNKSDEPTKVVMGPAVIWARLHGEWFLCPEKTMRAQIHEIRRFIDGGLRYDDMIKMIDEVNHQDERHIRKINGKHDS